MSITRWQKNINSGVGRRVSHSPVSSMRGEGTPPCPRDCRSGTELMSSFRRIKLNCWRLRRNSTIIEVKEVRAMLLSTFQKSTAQTRALAGKSLRHWRESNPRSSVYKTDALTTKPQRLHALPGMSYHNVKRAHDDSPTKHGHVDSKKKRKKNLAGHWLSDKLSAVYSRLGSHI